VSNQVQTGLEYLPVQFDEYIKVFKPWRTNDILAKSAITSRAQYEAILKNANTIVASEIEAMFDLTEAYPAKFYVPTGDNERIIRNFAHCLDKGNVIAVPSSFSANGIGKTYLSVLIAVNLLYGIASPWFNFGLFRKFPFKEKTIWYCSQSSALKKGELIEKTFKYFLKGYENWNFNYDGRKLASLNTGDENDWSLIYKSYDQDIKQFESTNVSVAILDEPPYDAQWKAIKGRGRDGLIMFLNFTPIYCPAYTMDEIEKAIREGRPGYSKVTATIYGTSKDNELGKRGFRPQEEIEETVRTYSEDEKEAREKGIPTHYHGMVYKQYDEKEHLVKVDKEIFKAYLAGEKFWFMPDKNAIYIHVIDPHDSRPDAMIWAFVNPNGRYGIMASYPFDNDKNYWEFNKSPSENEIFEGIIQREYELSSYLGMEDQLPVARRILDKRFCVQSRGKKKIWDSYRELGNEYRLSGEWVKSYSAAGSQQSEILYGHKLVEKLMTTILPDKHSKFVIWDWDLSYHIKNGMRNYSYKMKWGEATTMTGMLEPRYKDFGDLTRYLAGDRQNIETMIKEIEEENAMQKKRRGREKKKKDLIAGLGEY